MYEKILVALENSGADQSLLPHVSKLALAFHSRLLLLHVADGWVARNFDWLKLSESEEMRTDQAYLDKTAQELMNQGLAVTTKLELGNPPDQILKVAESEGCDLIAMTSHGHRFLGDLFLGSTINEVRHQTSVPVLLVKAKS
jgi:nucleotide-binding universal stress UspA family protein